MADSEPIRPATTFAPVYEHPWAVRFSHWANAVTVDGADHERAADLRGVPELWGENSAEKPHRFDPGCYLLGGWLGGGLAVALHVHVVFRGGRAALRRLPARLRPFPHRDLQASRHRAASGRWFATISSGPKPPPTGQYNPLQKLAYTSTIRLRPDSLLTGLVMFKADAAPTLGAWFGGYHNARLIHFLSMCGMVAFIPGHLVMVALHGWDNFMSMVTGWKGRPLVEPQGNSE